MIYRPVFQVPLSVAESQKQPYQTRLLVSANREWSSRTGPPCPHPSHQQMQNVVLRQMSFDRQLEGEAFLRTAAENRVQAKWAWDSAMPSSTGSCRRRRFESERQR